MTIAMTKSLMRRALPVVVIIGLCSAEAQAQQSLAPGMDVLGVQVTRAEGKGLTALAFHCDEQKALAAIPALQALGALNPDITQTQINLAPALFSSAVAMHAVIGYLEAAYKDSAAMDRVKAQVTLRAPDDYGHLREHVLFTFSFNRALYRKIDWDHFQVARFSKVAPNFRFSEWFTNSLINP